MEQYATLTKPQHNYFIRPYWLSSPQHHSKHIISHSLLTHNQGLLAHGTKHMWLLSELANPHSPSEQGMEVKLISNTPIAFILLACSDMYIVVLSNSHQEQENHMVTKYCWVSKEPKQHTKPYLNVSTHSLLSWGDIIRFRFRPAAVGGQSEHHFSSTPSLSAGKKREREEGREKEVFYIVLCFFFYKRKRI